MREISLNLQRLGFAEKEAEVYLAVLNVGHARVNDIAEIGKVNRATAYSVLKNLSQKGLVTACRERGDIHYRAESPAVILSLLEMQQEELDQRKSVADTLVDKLKAIHNVDDHKPRIRYIETIEGLRAMQKEYELLGDDIIQLVGYDTFLNLHGDSAHQHHHQHLATGGRQVRLILVTNEVVDFDFNCLECVTVSPDLMEVKGEMCVCGDRLILFSFSSNILAVEIRSPAIAGTVRASLELAWNEAKRLAKKA